MRLAWLSTALILAAGLAALHIMALEQYLYWRYVWLDMPIHFLGGMTIAMVVVGMLPGRPRPITFLAVMAGVILGWEAFEYLIGTPQEANFVFDSSLDLLMGALGAFTAYAAARYTLWRSA